MSTQIQRDAAGLARRLASLTYELLLLAAVLLAGCLPAVMLAERYAPPAPRAMLQGWVVFLCGFYFIWQWLNGGQTLPMKTWRIRLVAAGGEPLGLRRALRRYVLAWIGTAACGIGFWWALFDRDGQFLHDRLSGTRIVRVPAATGATGAPAAAS